jgi:hypothetical protein
LAPQQFVQARRGWRWKEPGKAVLATQGDGRIDQILDQAWTVDFHPLPRAQPHPGAFRSLVLRPALPNAAGADGMAQINPELFLCL